MATVIFSAPELYSGEYFRFIEPDRFTHHARVPGSPDLSIHGRHGKGVMRQDALFLLQMLKPYCHRQRPLE